MTGQEARHRGSIHRSHHHSGAWGVFDGHKAPSVPKHAKTDPPFSQAALPERPGPPESHVYPSTLMSTSRQEKMRFPLESTALTQKVKRAPRVRGSFRQCGQLALLLRPFD